MVAAAVPARVRHKSDWLGAYSGRSAITFQLLSHSAMGADNIQQFSGLSSTFNEALVSATDRIRRTMGTREVARISHLNSIPQDFAKSIFLLPPLAFFWVFIGSKRTPVGFDGYYYVLQCEGLLQSGHLRYDTPTPILFYIHAGLLKVSGTPLLAIKSSIVIALILLFVAMCKFLSRLGTNTWRPPFCASVLLVSGPFTLLEIEFVKNLWGILFVCAAYDQLIDALTRNRAVHFAMAVFLALCALFTHRLAALFIAFGFAYALGFKALLKNRQARTVLSRISRDGGIIAALILGITVLALTSGCLTFRNGSTLGSEGAVTFMPLVLLVLCIAILLLPSDDLQKYPPRSIFETRMFASVPLFVTLFCCVLAYCDINEQTNEIVDRTCLMAFTFAGPLCLYLLLDRFKWSLRGLLILSVSVILATLSLLARPTAGLKVSSRYPSFPATCAVCQSISEKTVIVAPHGIDFLLSEKYGMSATHKLPRTYDSRHIYRFIWKENLEAFKDVCSGANNICIDLGPGQLIRDDVYREAL